jgi:hypothetical protein
MMMFGRIPTRSAHVCLKEVLGDSKQMTHYQSLLRSLLVHLGEEIEPGYKYLDADHVLQKWLFTVGRANNAVKYTASISVFLVT